MPGCSSEDEATQEKPGTSAMELKAGPTKESSRAAGHLRWLCRLLLAMSCLAPAGLFSRIAWGEPPSRDEVEAAYLYNFGKFVRWPASAQGPLVICVAAHDGFAQTLSQLVSGEQIDQRPLRVRSLNNAEGVPGCSILFVGATESARVNAFLAAAAGRPILTVGDADDFLVRGGAIQFVLMEDHVRFSVNLTASDRSGLGLSSELLKVAVSVTTKGGAR